MAIPATFDDCMPAAYQGASPNSRFLAGEVPAGTARNSRLGGAVGASVLTHAGLLLLFLFVISQVHEAVSPETADPPDVVWLDTKGPGGGGGGGGNKMPEPPRKIELPGKEKITVPVAKPKIELPKEIPPPVQQITIPAVAVNAGVVELPGAMAAITAPSPSQGLGSGGGTGTGRGTGSGSGQGSGLGPGFGGGTGGGEYRPGNGITSPRLIKEVKPSYTGDAMRAKIQGLVTMEAVVLPDGSVGRVQILRSLDPQFGLDQEAIRTVKQWRFAPGMNQATGQPVSVVIEIEMSFTLR